MEDEVSNPFEAIEISKDIYWVGAIDWALRNFHGYETGRGTTYNAYLILDNKITLLDTVKPHMRTEFLQRVKSVIDPEKIDYIVSNHSEMDHSGLLPEMISLMKPEKAFASAMGQKALHEHFHFDPDMITPVKEGDEIKLGKRTLQVIETKMLHWPDSMATYLPDEQILFSQDIFGLHLATSERFTDEVDSWIVDYEAAKYYANIVLPFSNLVSKLIGKVADLPIKMIANDHGPLWRTGEQISRITKLYGKWASLKPYAKVVILYDTMWGSSALIASAIAEGVRLEGVSCKVMPLAGSHRSDIATETLEAGALIVGSPTINNNMFPTVAEVLSYLKGLKRKNLIGTAFSSYGWGGEAHKQIQEILASMDVELIGEGIKVKYVPDSDSLAEAKNLGVTIANKLKKKTDTYKGEK